MTFLQVTGLQTSARAGPLRAYAPVCGQGRQTGRAWGRPSYTATSGVQPHGVCVQRDRDHDLLLRLYDLNPDAQRSSACHLSVLILALEILEFLSAS